MVGCCVEGCTNSSTKGFRMTRIPSEPVRKLNWAIAINRPKFNPKSQYYVCEVHFRRDMWHVTQAGKIILKKDAVPVLFGSATFTKPMRNQLITSCSQINVDNLPVEFADDVHMEAVAESLSESDSQSLLKQQVDKQQVTIIELREEISHLHEQLCKKDSQLAHMEKILEASQECRNYFEEKYHSSKAVIAEMKSHVNLVRCCVESCESSSDRGFRLFQFPAETSKRQQWIENIFGPHWTPEIDKSVCEVHFEDDMWTKTTNGQVCLKDTAIPTFFVKRKSFEEEVIQPVSNGRTSTSIEAQLYQSVKEKLEQLVTNNITSRSVEVKLDVPIKDEFEQALSHGWTSTSVEAQLYEAVKEEIEPLVTNDCTSTSGEAQQDKSVKEEFEPQDPHSCSSSILVGAHLSVKEEIEQLVTHDCTSMLADAHRDESVKDQFQQFMSSSEPKVMNSCTSTIAVGVELESSVKEEFNQLCNGYT